MIRGFAVGVATMIPEWAGKYIGREYKPPYGCFLMVADVLREQYGIKDIPDFSDGLELDGFRGRANRIYKALEENTIEVPSSESRDGDIVTITSGGFPIHVGILLDQSHILHMVDGVNVCIENIHGVRLKSRIGGFYRVSINEQKND